MYSNMWFIVRIRVFNLTNFINKKRTWNLKTASFWIFLRCRYRFREFVMNQDRRMSITRAGGCVNQRPGPEMAFPAIYRKNGTAEQMQLLSRWQRESGDVVLPEWINQPASFRWNIFQVPVPREARLRIFSSRTGIFTLFWGIICCCAEFWRTPLLFWEWCSEKMASYRIMNGSFFSWEPRVSPDYSYHKLSRHEF